MSKKLEKVKPERFTLEITGGLEIKMYDLSSPVNSKPSCRILGKGRHELIACKIGETVFLAIPNTNFGRALDYIKSFCRNDTATLSIAA